MTTSPKLAATANGRSTFTIPTQRVLNSWNSSLRNNRAAIRTNHRTQPPKSDIHPLAKQLLKKAHAHRRTSDRTRFPTGVESSRLTLRRVGKIRTGRKTLLPGVHWSSSQTMTLPSPRHRTLSLLTRLLVARSADLLSLRLCTLCICVLVSLFSCPV